MKGGGSFLHIGELYVFSFVYKICMYCSSCGSAESIILPIEELEVFFFLKSCKYYSSFERAADILLLWKSWMYSSSFSKDGLILLPIAELQVFFFLWKSCSYSFPCERSAGLLLPVEELQLFFFLWKVRRYPSSCCLLYTSDAADERPRV